MSNKIKCPQCGQTTELRIETTCVIGITADAEFSLGGELDWDDTSVCYCPICEWEGMAADAIDAD